MKTAFEAEHPKDTPRSTIAPPNIPKRKYYLNTRVRLTRFASSIIFEIASNFELSNLLQAKL
jgi:hypothetical protein